MALAHSTMHQVAPHTWTFKAPEIPVAPMKANCRVCRQSVAILRPSAMDLKTGNYVVRCECKRCGAEILLIVTYALHAGKPFAGSAAHHLPVVVIEPDK